MTYELDKDGIVGVKAFADEKAVTILENTKKSKKNKEKNQGAALPKKTSVVEE